MTKENNDAYDVDFELLVLNALMRSDKFARSVISNVKPSYFSSDPVQDSVGVIKNYFIEHRTTPRVSVIISELKEKFRDDPKRKDKLRKIVACLKEMKHIDFDIRNHDEYKWLYDKTKSFVKKEALYNAILESAEMVDGTEYLTDNSFQSILQKVREAIGMSFDEDMGLDYFDEVVSRFNRMENDEKIFPTGFPELDRETGGGWHSKSVSIVMGSTGMGKSMLLENFTVNLVRQEHDVVYLTLELAEDEIAKRLDGKFTNITINEIRKKKEKVSEKLREFAENNDHGKLIIKEFPPSYTVSQFENYLEELEIKKGIDPDVLVVDYLGEMAPEDKGDNSYQDLKFVTRELQSLASRKDYPILSAAQVNRKGYDSPADLKHTSDSIGIPQVIDFSMVIWQNDVMEENHEVEAIIRKNRFGKNGGRFKFHVNYKTLGIKSEEQIRDETDDLDDEKEPDMVSESTNMMNNFKEDKEND